MMEKSRSNFKLFLIITLVLPLFLFVFKTDTVDHVDAADHNDIEIQEDLVSEDTKAMNVEITHQEILTLTNQFMDTLVQDIDEYTYKVLHFNSKEELLTAFESVTTEVLAKPYVDFYYEEEEDGLYIVPTSTPPWFESENDYNVVQLDENTVKVIQFNETEFYGDYEIELELTFDDNWTITDIVYP